MQIAVLVKQVPDTATRIRVADDGRSIVTDGIKWVMNPYDEFAVEEALKIRDQLGGEVVLVSLGPARAEETIRQGLAMGADRAIRVSDDGMGDADHLGVARVLAAALRQESWDLIFCGKQAVDDDAAQVGPLVAVELGLPQVMVVLELKVDQANGRLVAQRELEGAVETVELPMPAVVGAQRGLNNPRYPTLPNIMKAKRKELKVLSLAELGLSSGDVQAVTRVRVEEYFMPPPRPEARILTGDPVEAAKSLVDLLHREAKVI
jgi:electron transfer flavoprotein beta subunit